MFLVLEGDGMGVDGESMHISTRVYFLYKQEMIRAFLKSGFVRAHRRPSAK